MNSIALNHVYNAFMLDTITKPPYLYTWKLLCAFSEKNFINSLGKGLC